MLNIYYLNTKLMLFIINAKYFNARNFSKDAFYHNIFNNHVEMWEL